MNAQTENEYTYILTWTEEKYKKIIIKRWEKKYPEIKCIEHEIWVFINVTNK